jgi:hypothetical protein
VPALGLLVPVGPLVFLCRLTDRSSWGPSADTVEMTRRAGVEGSRRGPWRFLLAAKVALALGVLVAANLAVGLGGLHAVAVTNQQPTCCTASPSNVCEI